MKIDELANCSHEEADTRIGVHAYDTAVSALQGRGKGEAWETWNVCESDVTDCFAQLSNTLVAITEAMMNIVERFVVYDRTSSDKHVNDSRSNLFTKKGCSIENIPPSQAVLEQHVKRAMYQAGNVWGQAIVIA